MRSLEPDCCTGQSGDRRSRRRGRLSLRPSRGTRGPIAQNRRARCARRSRNRAQVWGWRKVTTCYATLQGTRINVVTPAPFRSNRDQDAPDTVMPPRRFPPPWMVDELDAAFVIRDHGGQALAYVYFEDEP